MTGPGRTDAASRKARAMALLAEGKALPEIAADLRLSVRSVRRYVSGQRADLVAASRDRLAVLQEVALMRAGEALSIVHGIMVDDKAAAHVRVAAARLVTESALDLVRLSMVAASKEPPRQVTFHVVRGPAVLGPEEGTPREPVAWDVPSRPRPDHDAPDYDPNEDE